MSDIREQLAEALRAHYLGLLPSSDQECWLQDAEELLPLIDRIANQRAADELEKAAAYWNRPNLRTIAADLRDRAAALVAGTKVADQ